MKLKLFFLVAAASLCAPYVQAESPKPAKRIECVCVFYPHWHVYPKGNEWFHEGWTEWEFVKSAKRRFKEQKQPMVPLAGFLDESNPADMAKEIALAANAGIDVFLYDYYWYDGKITQEEALEKGFLGAHNRDRMKFAIMWCYHERNDQFRPKLGGGRRRLMSLAHREECLPDIERISPAALLRKATPSKVPKMHLVYAVPYEAGKPAKDPTHSPAFGVRFAEIAGSRGIPCDVICDPRDQFRAAFTWLAEVL